MGGQKPTKPEIAQMIVMSTLGHSSRAISKAMNNSHSHNTVSKYAHSGIHLTDPEISKLVKFLEEKEEEDLILIIGKARAAIHQYLDDVLAGIKQPNPIALVAIADRHYNQLQLLQNKPTEIVDNYSQTMKLMEEAEALKNERKKLEEEIREEEAKRDEDDEEESSEGDEVED